MNTKRTILFILWSLFGTVVLSQNPTYQQKLFYSCKVWGFAKYYHSNVSIGLVNWDSVLVSSLPLIKYAATNDEFNDALAAMLATAGPMEIATTPSSDTLPPELKINLNFSWINDPVFRPDIKEILDTIKNNFRPHANYWVQKGVTIGYLWFPSDDPIIDSNAYINYPCEFTRLQILFSYWNIINYFNPYNYILDTPWDSTFYQNVLSIATASNYIDYYKSIKRISAYLDDAHVQGLTWSAVYSIFNSYCPKIILRYSQDKYIVVKSGYESLSKGDIIVSVDGKTPVEIEENLRSYISAGNPAVFRRYMCMYMLRGDSSSQANIEYRNSLNQIKVLTVERKYLYYDNWLYDYYPNDTLGNVKFKKWDCNIGYVNMGKLMPSDVDSMYYNLYQTSAIIFDIRNYPNGTALYIADWLYPVKMCFAKFTVPDILYPGTYYWPYGYAGYNGNPFSYAGKVIILCNQETQSQAEYTCMVLSAMPDAVVIGSQTAGADGNISKFNLSQEFQVGYTSLGVYYPNGDPTQRIGIVPDSVVYITPEGIRQGRDEVLEKALQVAGCLVPILSVNPSSQKVDAPAGIIGFTVTANTNWSAVSDADWCKLTYSGSGNGTIIAEYTDNVFSQSRIANLVVKVAGLPDQTVILEQNKSTIGIDECINGIIKIYPNPTTGILRIITPQDVPGLIEVNVLDSQGRSILNKQFKSGTDYELDLSFVPKGSYILIIKTGENSVVKKIIID